MNPTSCPPARRFRLAPTLPVLLLAACSGVPTPTTQLDAGCAQAFTAAFAIQGSGAASPLDGQEVVTQGVVSADFEGAAPALRGFYMQDARGDGDERTSDGVFVFNRDRDDVSVGDVVRVSGTVSEFQGQTQVTASSILQCGRGSVQAVDVTLPLPSAGHLERFEGMLVRLPQALYVTEHYQLGRYGEVVLSSGGRLPLPTAVAAPGAAARAVQAANDLNRIMLDDASLQQNPEPIPFARAGAPLDGDNTLRGGDEVTGITGVLTHTAAAGTTGVTWRVRPVNEVPAFVAANPRPAPPAVGGTMRIASFNVLNYFNTFEGCRLGVGGAVTDCRGAENEAELERQGRKTVAAIVAMDADVVGILEIENDGYGDASAIADLVRRLNAATAPGTYAFVDADAATGQADVLGTDAIKVGLLYRPGRVTPAGRTAVLASTAFTHGGDAEVRTRPSLTQAFARAGGGRIVVSINHLKSKGSPCDEPDAGDGQGHCNGPRTAAARALVAWLATDPTGTGERDVLILGDLNAYAREDPVTALVRAGYTDLLAAHAGARAYSYVFNGQWGYLDHALASASLLPRVSGAAPWHINADEPPVLDYNINFRSAAQQAGLFRPGPFRSSDHDPVLVGIR
jgi:predicted extracellular nuclease